MKILSSLTTAVAIGASLIAATPAKADLSNEFRTQEANEQKNTERCPLLYSQAQFVWKKNTSIKILLDSADNIFSIKYDTDNKCKTEYIQKLNIVTKKKVTMPAIYASSYLGYNEIQYKLEEDKITKYKKGYPVSSANLERAAMLARGNGLYVYMEAPSKKLTKEVFAIKKNISHSMSNFSKHGKDLEEKELNLFLQRWQKSFPQFTNALAGKWEVYEGSTPLYSFNLKPGNAVIKQGDNGMEIVNFDSPRGLQLTWWVFDTRPTSFKFKVAGRVRDNRKLWSHHKQITACEIPITRNTNNYNGFCFNETTEKESLPIIFKKVVNKSTKIVNNRKTPKDPVLSYNLWREGTDYQDLQQLIKAEKSFTAAIKADTAFSYPYLSRCSIRITLKKYQKAIEDCNMAIKISGMVPDAVWNRALSFYYLQNYKQFCADAHLAIKYGEPKALKLWKANPTLCA